MSSEPAWSEPELPAPPPPRERHLGLFSAATPSGQVAEAPRRVHWACWSGLQRLRSSAPRWRPRWPPPQIVLRSCDFFVSQRRLAPPGRVRGPRAAQEGSGALGDVLIRSSYSLEASGTRQHTCQRAAGGRGKWHNSTLISSAKRAEAASRRRTSAPTTPTRFTRRAPLHAVVVAGAGRRPRHLDEWRRREVRGVRARHGHDDVGGDGVGLEGIVGPDGTASPRRPRCRS